MMKSNSPKTEPWGTLKRILERLIRDGSLSRVISWSIVSNAIEKSSNINLTHCSHLKLVLYHFAHDTWKVLLNRFFVYIQTEEAQRGDEDPHDQEDTLLIQTQFLQ